MTDRPAMTTITPSSRLEELAAKCEQADGPNYDLEVDIAFAIAGQKRPPKNDIYMRVAPPPNYTASLDAATTLFPSDDGETLAFWRSGNDGEGGNPDAFKADLLICGAFASTTFTAVAATEPLARCAVALRAHAKLKGEGNE
jgi:hypothetical protein